MCKVFLRGKACDSVPPSELTLMIILAQHSSDNVSPGGVICHTFQNKLGCLVVSDQALLYLVSGRSFIELPL